MTELSVRFATQRGEKAKQYQSVAKRYGNMQLAHITYASERIASEYDYSNIVIVHEAPAPWARQKWREKCHTIITYPHRHR